MIIKIECNEQERQAIKAMAQKHVIKSFLVESATVVTPKGEDTIEIKPKLVVSAAKLIEIVAPIVSSELYAWKNTIEALKPYFTAVAEAAREEG